MLYIYVENGVYMEARAGQTEHQNRSFRHFAQKVNLRVANIFYSFSKMYNRTGNIACINVQISVSKYCIYDICLTVRWRAYHLCIVCIPGMPHLSRAHDICSAPCGFKTVACWVGVWGRPAWWSLIFGKFIFIFLVWHRNKNEKKKRKSWQEFVGVYRRSQFNKVVIGI